MSIEEQKNDVNDVPIEPDRELVMIEWQDSQSSAGWEHESRMNKNYVLPTVYTTGFLVDETKAHVMVAQSMLFYKEVSNQVCGLMSIPRGCIVSTRHLRTGKKYRGKHDV